VIGELSEMEEVRRFEAERGVSVVETLAAGDLVSQVSQSRWKRVGSDLGTHGADGMFWYSVPKGTRGSITAGFRAEFLRKSGEKCGDRILISVAARVGSAIGNSHPVTAFLALWRAPRRTG